MLRCLTMRPLQGSPRTFLPVAIALIVVFAGQAFFCSRIKSPVFDEPAHIAAGLAYLETDTFTANRQHPPLLKEISAASLLLGGVHWPTTPDAEKLVQGAPGFEWPVGNSIISTNGPGRVPFWARLPFILLFGHARSSDLLLRAEMMGERAAIGAVFLIHAGPHHAGSLLPGYYRYGRGSVWTPVLNVPLAIRLSPLMEDAATERSDLGHGTHG